jgi:hypothetical protein
VYLSFFSRLRYPKSTHYIRCSLPTVISVPSIVRAMKKYGQLDKEAFRLALAWGNSPTIEIVAGLDACASFTPTPGNNTIQIRQSIFDDFEAGRGWLLARAGWVAALGVNILHETVHWGDNLDGVDWDEGDGEEGEAFEMDVYGRNLSC